MTVTLTSSPRMKTSFKYFSAIFSLLLLTIVFPVFLFHFLPSRTSNILVVLPQGTLIGFTSSASLLPQPVDHFLGIPFAESTAGNNRFRAPVRIKDGESIFNATSYGPRCPAGFGPGGFGEDCLRINVYRPSSVRRKKGKGVPVVVHVHGGAFNSGFGNSRDMALFTAQASTPMIGASFNYRTGAFGFLPGEAARKDGALNVGLKDMVSALQWVKENIASFGGDPDQVTVMGSSAGAHGIGHLVMFLGRDGSEDLFQRAIVESGAATARAVYPYDHEVHKEQFRTFLTFLGLQSVPEEDIMSKLRDVSLDKLKRASDDTFNHYNPSVKWPFQPVIDGEGGTIDQAPLKNWQQGKWKRVPILTGFNTNEGAMFVPSQIASSTQFRDFFHTLLPGLNETDLNELERVYTDPKTDASSKYRETRTGLGTQFKRTEQAYGQFAYVAPVKQTAQFASRAGQETPVFLYHFAVNCSVDGGANHGTESAFVVNDPELQSTSETLQRVGGLMHTYWASFAATGDPNAVKDGRYADRLEWKRFVGREDGLIAIFGDGNDELAGGDEEGTAVRIGKDTFAVEGSAFWQARTEKFES